MTQSKPSSVKPMMGYVTTDGKIHATEIDAKVEQHILDIKEDLDAFVGHSIRRYTDLFAVLEWERVKKRKELENEQK